MLIHRFYGWVVTVCADFAQPPHQSSRVSFGVKSPQAMICFALLASILSHVKYHAAAVSDCSRQGLYQAVHHHLSPSPAAANESPQTRATTATASQGLSSTPSIIDFGLGIAGVVLLMCLAAAFLIAIRRKHSRLHGGRNRSHLQSASKLQPKRSYSVPADTLFSSDSMRSSGEVKVVLGFSQAGDIGYVPVARVIAAMSSPSYALDNNNNGNSNYNANLNINLEPVNDSSMECTTNTTTKRLARWSSLSSSNIKLWEIDSDDCLVALNDDGQPIELGRGSFGCVYAGSLRGVQPAAIKVLNLHHTEDIEVLEREAAILMHVNRDRNIVQLYGTSKLPSGEMLLIMELMEGGDLRQALDDENMAKELEWDNVGKRVAIDVAIGLTALHATNVIHRDLNSRNVLLTASLTAKVADVGIAAVHSKGYLTACAPNVMGTLAWSAPELLLGRRCTEKIDVYSLGVILWEIATGCVPQQGCIHLPVRAGHRRCSPELIALIKDCLEEDPEMRPTAKQVCQRLMLM